MKVARKIVNVLFLLSIILFSASFFLKEDLPDKDKLLNEMNQAPTQVELAQGSFLTTKDDYQAEIAPKFTYELYGLVVAEYDSQVWHDVMHDEDPFNSKDLCVVWGDNALSGAYKNGKFSHGEFTCYWYFDSYEDFKNFSKTEIANNHMIPATQEIAEEIKKTRVGDQIYFKGYLSDYKVTEKDSGRAIYSRSTSVTRDDIGDHACEIIYVEDFEILKKNNEIFTVIYRNIKYPIIGLGGLSVLMLLI